MKKAKKMILLYFLHQTLKNRSRDNLISYNALYEALPLSQSTIRGILQEFLRDQLVRRKANEMGSFWLLSDKGKRFALLLFPAFIQTASLTAPSVLIIPSGAKNQTKARQLILEHGGAQLDRQSYLFFESIVGLEKQITNLIGETVLVQLLSASEKVISSFWFASKKGMRAYANRESLYGKIVNYRRKTRTYSPMSQTVRKFLLKSIADIITATEIESRTPEIYYPHELRISFFTDQIWSTEKSS